MESAKIVKRRVGFPSGALRAALAGLLVVGLVLAVTAGPLRAEVRRYAVVVGVANYLNLSGLDHTDEDAIDFRAALLTDPRWSTSNIQLLLNSQATYSGIHSAINWMAAVADSDDICVFFFSGHGGASYDYSPIDETDGYDEYLLPYDSDLYSYDYDIRDEVLSGWLNAVPAARIIVFIDACYAGGLIEDHITRMAKGIKPKTVNFTDMRPAAGDGFAEDLVRPKEMVIFDKNGLPRIIRKDLDDLTDIVVLVSCTEMEISYEYGTLGHGVFSYVLLEALGATLTDANRDGELSAEELFDYLSPRVASYFAEDTDQERQHSQLCDNAPGESNMIAAPPAAPTTVFASVDFSTNPGWTTQGSWAFGVPNGAACEYGDPDPTSGHTGLWLYGYNLFGQYANNLSPQNLTSTAFNCSDYENVHVRFWRWLGVEGWSYDQAKFQASNNGSTWTTIWVNDDASVSDLEWVQYEFDISAVADGHSTVYLRWVMGATDESFRFCGWNIDDVELRGDQVIDPLEISAALDHNWVYQNTLATTQDRHKSVLTISLDSGVIPGETYNVTILENGAALANFTTQATGNPLVINVVGGRTDASTPSAPASRTLNVSVAGQTYGQSDSASVDLKLCKIGDINGDGNINAVDKAHMNAWLNGMPLPGDTVRHVDLNGDNDVTAIDKVQVNRQLNALGIL